jgi:hypothetical protein
MIVALAVACTALAVASFAATPVISPQQRVDENGGTEAANETTGAGTDVNSGELVAGWNDWRDSGASEAIRCGVALSLDGGETWDDFVVRPPGGNQSSVEGDPMTAVDPRTGTLWVGAISFAGNGGLYVARKNPGDDFFQPSVMADAGSGVDKCWMVAGRNNLTPNSTRVYITYNFGAVRSDDMGDSWTNPVSLGSGVGFLPRIGPNGEVYVTYWNYSNERFEVKRSLDGGASFVTRLIAPRMDTWGAETFNTRFAGTFRVAPLPGLAVDPNDGTLYAVWPDTTDQPGGQANVDVYFSLSLNQGDSWSTPVILNSEGPFIGDQFFPWIEVDSEGRLHVVYLDSRHTDQQDNDVDGYFDAYYAYSENKGGSWTEFRLTPHSWNSDDDGLDRDAQFIGDYLGMAVTEEAIWPFYPDSSAGDTDTFTNKITVPNCLLPAEATDLTVSISEDGSELTFHWTDAPLVFSHMLFEDDVPYGRFTDVAGTAASGVAGLTLPTPTESLYYLVAGRNGCGIGPKK